MSEQSGERLTAHLLDLTTNKETNPPNVDIVSYFCAERE